MAGNIGRKLVLGLGTSTYQPHMYSKYKSENENTTEIETLSNSKVDILYRQYIIFFVCLRT